jgi:hypothetical protein
MHNMSGSDNPQGSAPTPEVHHLSPKSLIIKSQSERGTRESHKVKLVRAVLQEQVPGWRERFPAPEELPHAEYLRIAERVLEKDPRTRDWLAQGNKRKTIMRAGYRER